MDYAKRVFRYSWHSGNDEPHILEYRILNRINLFHLQNELAKLKSAVWNDFSAKEDDLARLRTTLHDYGKSSHASHESRHVSRVKPSLWKV